MNQTARALATILLCAAAAPGQAEATTISSLATEAAHVVVARATQRTDPDASVVRVAFETIEDLRGGTAPRQFSLSEPSGACCSQLLFTVATGDHLVLFLDRVGQRLHLRGGSRAGIPASEVVVAHVRALCVVSDPMERAGVLADALESTDGRIRADAALALAAAPMLPVATPALETSLARQVVERGRVPAPDLPALLRICARLDLAAPRRALLDTYLAANEPGQEQTLRMWLASHPAASVASDLAAATLDEDPKAVRAARLLAELPTAHAVPVLQRLARHPFRENTLREVGLALLVHGVQPVGVLDVPAAAPRPRMRVVPAGRTP